MSQLRKTLDSQNPSELVLAAGAIAGSAEVITTYPLDTIKTHMQIKKNGNTLTTGMNIIQKSGIKGLYFGVIPSLAQVAGKASLRFTLYEKIKNSFKDENGKVSNSKNLIAGLSSGAIEAMVWTSPTERVKIIQQNSKKYISTQNVISNILTNNGIQGLYIGTVPTIYKQSLSVGSRFWMYNLIKDFFEKDGQKITSSQTVFTGALAGGLSTTFNHPFDVVKSRIQSNTNKGKTFQIMKDIHQKEGIFTLFSGLSPRFYRVAIAQGVTFYIYESIINFYQAIV
tara:strand:+ start:156 stop:1004 length:849 start_codon:yes stop_codon:yes gene_type:complete